MENNKIYKLGIDIGSTTVKIALLDEADHLIFADYQRHYANIREALSHLLKEAYEKTGDVLICPMITGSGGLTLAKHLGVDFIQEVVAVSTALEHDAPQTDVAIELGGEDAKIIYFENGNVEQRMNGVCAGGTGSFIDQMASLLQTDASGLNEYAKHYNAIYPIAARCGVFAKSDIQPLINEGASKEDLAASIFQAVVNQTISGLACGKPIRGHVAFLGGPLHFLPELKEAFIRTLKLDEEHTIVPEDSHLFAAKGSALNYNRDNALQLSALLEKLTGELHMEFEVARMDPLFRDSAEYEEFIQRHAGATVKKGDLSAYKGRCYLGIDAGSTTTKVALVGEDGTLLYSFYSNNNGSPIDTSIRAIREIHQQLPADAQIVYSCSTGYGEALVKEAFRLDEGEVETIAHYTAAAFFDPDVDCILDIGGQDMKCIKIKNNTVDNVMLNEACSAGCGSFIETFAKSLNYKVEDFAKEALFAEHPIDLGTRCTVFMNSKVKQAQKEGASVADISAGLAYSVIKNALFKVIKLTDASQLGKNVVVQGGTFYNDAVFRSFELISGCRAIRPDIAGIMGAFGAALIARDRYEEGHQTQMLTIDEIEHLTFHSDLKRCGKCTNNCLLTINRFSDGRHYITGNRCERGLGETVKKEEVPNLFEYKLKRIFRYKPLKKEEAARGVIGMPRALNLYENYPFWAVFFKELKFQLILSPQSTRKTYELGIESIPSESECYPAKITHGHIQWLINHGITRIFYPCIPYERKEFPEASNNYNCPIVTSYAENIKNNVEEITSGQIEFHNPFMSFADLDTIRDRLKIVMKEEFGIPEHETAKAVEAGWAEMASARDDMRKKGEETIQWLKDNHRRGIVLAGRPYHIDPEINHGIPELITSYGFAVLTEDSVSHLHQVERPLVVLDQWMYHSRLYAAANYVKTTDNLDLIQLNSFGCGLDAITTDMVSDILTQSGKIYTCLKIDEVNNLGAARIRIRSLIAAIRTREKHPAKRDLVPTNHNRVLFTEEMRAEGYTIIAPQLSPIHFDILGPAFRSCGYNVVVLDNDTKEAVDTGLKYVNNDACYPSLIVVGQMLAAVESGKYDTDRLAIIMTQTGGGCRASNYVGFIRRALKKAGYPQIPVISLNLSDLEKNPGFSFTLPMAQKAVYGCVFGDILMRVINATRPYEAVPGTTDKMHQKWLRRINKFLCQDKKWLSHRTYKRFCREMVRDFDHIERKNIEKPKVGIVGEILVKFMPLANNHLAELIEQEGAEAVVPDFLDFFLYCFYNNNFKTDNLGFSKAAKRKANLGIWAIEKLRGAAHKALADSVHFDPPASIYDTARGSADIVSAGNQTGEGWFLTGEMIELINHGVNNIVCCQPFGCLPNHIVGKGVIKKVRSEYPDSNIVAIDFDPGASEVNQLNRIKLMLTTAQRNIEKKKQQQNSAH
ncbi:MAG: 2-hydroxyacyl-CoA dehydratase [Lachnospiraceae bacterium]|jgi:predicted CoA-substrate-specific enzyme activase|nr:2-hydroxyacyl-CoA dehydratase [Lachnospiraceae bacterium]MCI1656979.1 2-hydroxyacyl-CoA dehydratase [Lachnospiraceae bacterium]MCI2195459.1 2-hydroxyacyl-CoA dehydratase [Lachnospiraceae bacterium]